MQVILRYILLALLAFSCHLVWEKSHIPLYRGYESLGTGWRLALWATSGDVLYTLLIALVVATALKRLDWFVSPTARQLVCAALLGLLVALFVEYKALYLHKWVYGPEMPIIPLIHVGLSPILQMTLLTPAVLFLAGML